MKQTAAKQEKIADDKLKDSFEQQSAFIPEGIHEQPGMDNEEWEERLFQINGNQMKLKHKPLKTENAGTTKYEFEGDTLPIEQWLSIEPSRINGEVFAYEDEKGKSIRYLSMGGFVEFTIPGNEKQKAQMQIINIVMPEEGEAEIFLMLNEPVVIEPIEDVTLELEYGKYAKTAADTKGTMYFQDAKMYYKDTLIKESSQVESDENGLRFDGKDTLSFQGQHLDKKEQKEQEEEEHFETEMFFDAGGAHLDVWKNVFFTINGKEIKLNYKPLSKEKQTTSEYRFDNNEWELQKGFKIHPKENSAIVSEHVENSGKEKTVSYVSWGEGNAVYRVPNLEHDKERKVALGYLSIKMEPDKNVQINFSMKDNPIIIYPDKSLDTLVLKLRNGSYKEGENGVKFWDSEVFYKEKSVKRIDALVSDEKGLHMPDESDLQFDKKATNKKTLDRDILNKDEYRKLEDKKLDFRVGLEFSESGIDIVTWENAIYKTLDKFAEIRDVEEGEDEEGNKVEEGNIYLSDIPIMIFFEKDKDPIEEKVEAPEEPVEGVTITANKNNEEIFSAEKEEPITVTYDLKEIEVETGTGTSSFKRTVTLEGLKIKDGKLVVEKVSIENALGREQESEDEAKEIFNCTVSGSIVHSSDSAKFTEKGLIAEKGKTTLGTLSVEEFLGFLSGSVNYPKGTISVSAGTEKETSNPHFLEYEGGNFAEGISIPIPGTMGILSAKFGLAPSAKIGGSIELEADRKKSFGEEWTEADRLQLGGTIQVDGEAGIKASAGLEAGIEYIANIDLVLIASLIASIAAQMNIETSLKSEKRGDKKKIRQAEDLTFKGEAGAELNGAVNLESNIKFLFWKKQLFDLELYNKKLAEVKLSFEAAKSPDSGGIFKGWELKNGEGFAQGLSKSVSIDFKDKEGRERKREEKRQKILEDAKGKAENAWAALMELESGQKDCAIILEVEEKTELEKQTEKLKSEVEKKIKSYLNVLNKESKRLKKISKRLKKNLERNQDELKRLDKLQSNEFSKKAEMGGFSKKNYKENTPSEMIAVDFMIARTLGEVSEENLTMISAKKDEELLHEGTFFGSDTSAEVYSQYTSYYRMLNDETITENRRLKDVPDPYRSIVEERNKGAKKKNQPKITNKELFQIALEGKYKDANEEEVTIEATAEQKEQLFEFCFQLPTKVKDHMGILGLGEAEARGAWMEKMNAELREKTGDKKITLERAAKEISNTDFYRLTETIETQIAETNVKLEETKKRQAKVTTQIEETEKIIEDYTGRLESMKTSATGALADKKFDAGQAKTALNIYSEEYLGRIKGVSEALEERGKKIKQKQKA